jgi:hypothetical protein
MPWSRKLPALRPLFDLEGGQSEKSSFFVRCRFIFENDVEHVCNFQHVVVGSVVVQAVGVHEDTVCVGLDVTDCAAKLLGDLAELLELLAEGMGRNWSRSTEEVGRVSGGDDVLRERGSAARDGALVAQIARD